MLPDTSIARMMVSLLRRQRDHRRRPRDAAISIGASASRNSSRRHVAPHALRRAHRLLHDGQAGVAQRRLLLAPQQPEVQPRPAAAARSSSQRNRARGRSSQRLQARRRCVPALAARRRRAGCGACAGRRSAAIGVDQVVVGGQLERVDAGVARSASRSSASRCAASARSACGSRGRGCRRTAARRSRRPASRTRPRSGSSISSGS